MSEFTSPYWATFNQINQLGARVRKGEHGAIIIFWKRLDQPETEHNEHEPAENEHERPHFVLRYYRVWNSQQCESLKVPESEASPTIVDDITPIERAEHITCSYLARPNAPKFTEVDYARTASYSPAFDTSQWPLRSSISPPKNTQQQNSMNACTRHFKATGPQA